MAGTECSAGRPRGNAVCGWLLFCPNLCFWADTNKVNDATLLSSLCKSTITLAHPGLHSASSVRIQLWLSRSVVSSSFETDKRLKPTLQHAKACKHVTTNRHIASLPILHSLSRPEGEEHTVKRVRIFVLSALQKCLSPSFAF